MEIKELKELLSKAEDPRRTDRGNIRHKLEDIIITGLCTLICNGEDFNDMEDFGKEREGYLKNFLELPGGIPDSDTFRRVFERLNPNALSECLHDWLNFKRKDGSVIAIDGKTIRGSENHEHKAYHVLSAFVAENQITLGELAVDEKSNEITAVPELLDMLDIENSIITADAMSCQRNIVEKITEKKADYVITLKGNQHALSRDVSLYFNDFDDEISEIIEREKNHGRIEKREYGLLTDISWLPDIDKWKGLNAVGRVRATVTENDKTSVSTRYFITSLTDKDRFAYAVRKHWSVENQLHWCLDVIFKEDDSRAKKDNSPLNLNVMRKMALALCKNCQSENLKKSSIQKRRYRASLNPEVLMSILFG